jgi:cytochrome c oxidase cbb3-type subunit 2
MGLFDKHAHIERNSILLLVLSLIVVSIGGLVQLVPLFFMETTIEKVKGIRPYTPLELTGFNIYVREGCYLCHSQQIRALKDEVERYGHYSLAAESMYDHPFQWGSKRNGPDLARVGGRYSDDWHVAHLTNPRELVPESIMPSYGWLAGRVIAPDGIAAHLKTLRIVGVPYTDAMIENAAADFRAQADPDADAKGLQKRYPNAIQRNFGGAPEGVTEMTALIAYLQVLGTMADLNAYDEAAGQR